MKWSFVVLVALAICCLGCESGSDGYSQSSLKGSWVGLLTYSDNDTFEATSLSFMFTFDNNGTVTAIRGRQTFTEISGTLAVSADGSVSGTLNTTHDTEVGPEYSVWVIDGSFAGHDRLILGIDFSWDNPDDDISGRVIMNADLERTDAETNTGPNVTVISV